ncbi:MAG TPA: hypothetical protein VGL10_08840, partial [Gammaproteobacteria bacterium]
GDIAAMVQHGETGVIVQPENPVATAKAVISLLENPAWAARMAYQARSEVERYTWPEVHPAWTSVYLG